MTNPYQDTIVAPATTPGTGAISIIRMSGPEVFRIADAVVQLRSGTISESDGYTIKYGEVYEISPHASLGRDDKGAVGRDDRIVISSEVEKSLLDEVLVSVFRAPHSYTGEDSVEISTHASAYIVQELIGLLLKAGARFAQPGEFTRRAFLNGKMDLAQAEAVADVIASNTSASHRVAMNQLKGGFSKELATLREQLLEMASLLELELDFSEEDVEFADRRQLETLLDATLQHVERLAASFRQGNMIKNGVPVAIVGAANAGKSTLLNTLLGEERAIVTDIPGTTRDTIEETLVIDGILFRFIDTAGIRDASDKVEKLGIDRTFRKLSEAEIVLGVLDSTADLTEQLQSICSRVSLDSQQLVLLLNKADIVGPEGVNKNVTTINKFVSSLDNKVDIIAISAKDGKGLSELKSALAQAEKGLIPNADSTFVTNTRHYEALLNASSALRDCRTSLSAGIPSDLVAEDLRRGLSSINAILGTGLLDPETILHTIFSRHCIGK